MRIAYLIMAHKEVDLLLKLLKQLNHSDIDIYLHFDLKSIINIEEFTKRNENLNVFLLSDRTDIVWGGYSILKVQIMLMNAAISTQKYDYISFISGQDLSIKSNDYILNFFRRSLKKDFFEFFPLPDHSQWSGEGGLDRFSYFWPIDQLGFDESVKFYEKQLHEKTKRVLPGGLKPYGGSNWITLSKDSATYVLEYIKSNPHFLIFFSMVAHPEEIFFQTIILNSHLKANVVNNNLRYIDWSSKGPHPKTLAVEDLVNLKNSEAHFARKFDPNKDSKVIDYFADSIAVANSLSNLS